MVARDADRDGGDVRAGCGTRARDGVAVRHLAAAGGGDDRRGSGTQRIDVRCGHLPEGNIGCCGAAEVAERKLLQREQHVPARPQRTGERMLRARGNEIGAAGDDACLGAAHQLVAAERDECGAGGERLACCGFTGQPCRGRAAQPRAVRVDQAAADVGHHRHAERRQFDHRCVLHEPLDAVVAGMHLEDEGDVDVLAGQGLRVVTEPRAVGGADVDEVGAALLHHIGHPEAATDLHALAAADRHLRLGGECGQHQQHCGRVVVDHHRRLGPAQGCEQATDR